MKKDGALLHQTIEMKRWAVTKSDLLQFRRLVPRHAEPRWSQAAPQRAGLRWSALVCAGAHVHGVWQM